MNDNEPTDSERTSSNWLNPELDRIPSATPPPDSEPAPPPRSSAWDVFALIGGIAGPVLAFASSGLLALVLPASRNRENIPLFVSIFIAVGLLGAPLAWYAARRMQGVPSANWRSQWWWVAAGGGLIVALMVLGQASVSLKLLPELSLAILQPIIFVAAGAALLAIAAGGWAGMSRLRAWGHLISGAWLSVALSFVAEVMLIGGLAAIVLVALAAIAPEQAIHILSLLRSMDNFNLNDVLDLALQPWAVALAFVSASLLIPLIEELLKPIGVVLILGRRPSPMAAFLGGVMGGVGFGVTETLGNLVTISDPWFMLVLARMGTLAMHGLAAGIAGWGWGQLAARRPLRFVGAFAGAVALHGLWNGCVVVTVFTGLYWTQNPEPGPLGLLLGLTAVVSVFLLIMLVPLCVTALGLIGYRLRLAPE